MTINNLINFFIECYTSLIEFSIYTYPLASPLIFIIINILLAIFLLPCSPMAFIAGVIWGGFYGTLITVFSALAAESVTFLLSRSFFQFKIERLLKLRYPKMVMILNKVRVHDWKLILLVQLNPLIPAASMGYAFGLCKIPFLRYILFSGLFMLPLTIMIAMTGSSVMSLLTDGQHWKMILLLGLVVVVLTSLIKNIFKMVSNLFGVQSEG